MQTSCRHRITIPNLPTGTYFHFPLLPARRVTPAHSWGTVETVMILISKQWIFRIHKAGSDNIKSLIHFKIKISPYFSPTFPPMRQIWQIWSLCKLKLLHNLWNTQIETGVTVSETAPELCNLNEHMIGEFNSTLKTGEHLGQNPQQKQNARLENQQKAGLNAKESCGLADATDITQSKHVWRLQLENVSVV